MAPSDPSADPAGPAADRIELRGLRVLGTHGVLPEEQRRPQPFELDLDLVLDLGPAAASDRLGDTVDYGAVADSAAGIVGGPTSYQLLEALAGAIASATLGADTRIASVTVGIRKLRPPLAVDITSVGVSVTRHR
jgi:dihydroneopterin aldolase